MNNRINKEKIDIFFQNIYENTQSGKKKKSLTIIYNVLLNLYESSGSNFSIAHIGKLSKKEGGPIAQTIRNTQGKDYRDFIDYFVDNITILNNNRVDTELIISDYIDDPALKAHINIIIAENKSLKSQLNIIKNNMAKNYELTYNSSDESLPKSNNSNLLSTEIESIKKFIKDVENNNLSTRLTAMGSLKDENDILIASPGLFEALKKIVST